MYSQCELFGRALAFGVCGIITLHLGHWLGLSPPMSYKHSNRRKLLLLGVFHVMSATASAQPPSTCSQACLIPLSSELLFCRGIVEYRACKSTSFQAMDEEAQQLANSSGIEDCAAAKQALCKGLFQACEYSTDTKQLCRSDCEAGLGQCPGAGAKGVCTTPLQLSDDASTCVALDYEGASYGMWFLGLAINFLFSFMAALGLNLQKKSLANHADDNVPPHRQRMWMLGFVTMTMGSVFDFVAFGLAPMSLLAPLAALTLVWNALIAGWMHGERVDRSNMLATGVIFVGVTVAVIFSSHSTPLYTVEKLTSLFLTEQAIVYMILTIIAGGGAAFVLVRYAGQSPPWKVVAYGLLAGAMGGQSVMFAKATVEIIKAAWIGAASLLTPAPWIVGILTAVLLVSQLRILNSGLEKYPALTMIPVYQSFWILCSTVSGLIYFDEWHELSGSQQAYFVIGTLLTLGGIMILLRGRAGQQSASGEGRPSHGGRRRLPQRNEEDESDSDLGDGDDVELVGVMSGGVDAEDAAALVAAAAAATPASTKPNKRRDAPAFAIDDDEEGGAEAPGGAGQAAGDGVSESGSDVDLLLDGDIALGAGSGGFALQVPDDGGFDLEPSAGRHGKGV